VSEPAFLLSGERAALGPLRIDYAPQLSPWFNDPVVRQGLAHRGLVDEQAERRWIEKMGDQAAEYRPSTIVFAIHDRADGAVVGVLGLERIDWAFGRCELGIFVGQRRGTGLGTDACRLALAWAFTIMSLHNVMLETYAYNEAALRAYRAAGFREIGRRRDAVVALGRRHDVILMDATPDDLERDALAELRRA
jgi:diamine N-acetyltransferase